MSFDWSVYKGNLNWLPARTIYLTRHGSHAYGTSLPTSDVDIRGICIAPKKYYLGFTEKFDQTVLTEPDITIFDLRKFMHLAADANPNVLEILYTVPDDHLLVKSPMLRLFENRDLFLSKKAKHTFSGYAVSQLKRIRLHRRWLLNPVEQPPIRATFGLPERTVLPADQLMTAQAAIQKRMDEWEWRDLEHLDPATRQFVQDEFARRLTEITQWSLDVDNGKVWAGAARSIGYDTNFIELLDRERRYGAAHREWAQYQEWKRSRNPLRAALEAKHGLDTKHAMHLVRLLRMCREILTEGKVIVRRPDAQELLAIRDGAWSYDQLVSWAEEQDANLTELAKVSSLPRQPNRVALDQLCAEIVEQSF